MQKKEEDRRIVEDQAAKDRYWKIPICYDDEDYAIAITPVLSPEEPVDSLIMEDEHLDAHSSNGKSNEANKSKCREPSFKEHSKTIVDSNNDSTSSDDDYPYGEDINYVDASPPDAEIVSLEVVESVIPEVKISSGSTTTLSNYSLPDYEVFNLDDDHIEEKSNGSTTTHADFSLPKYDSFIFDLSINPCPPADRSDCYHEEFVGELAHIISPPEYDCFYFKSEPDRGELTSIVDSRIRENVLSMTNVNLPFEDAQSPLLAFVVWIFLAFLTYPITPPYLLSTGSEDTIFDPDIST
ncbi:hypothetical protein Tco_1011803 [Tanacetum coccineum]